MFTAFWRVSEAVAHLDLAHSEGKIALELKGTRNLQTDRLGELKINAKFSGTSASDTACKAQTLPEEFQQ